MLEDLWFYWEQYRHIVAACICIWFHTDCVKHKRFLTSQLDSYMWGMLTIGITIFFKNLPVG